MLKYVEPIRYAKLLSQRKHPVTEQDEFEAWFARLGRVRRNKLKILHRRQNSKCFYCGVDTFIKKMPNRPKALNATLDHLITVSEGGTDHLHNMVCCCSRCNGRRGVIPWQQFKQMVADGYYENVHLLEQQRQERVDAREQRKQDNPQKQQQVKEFQFYLALVLMFVPGAQAVVDGFVFQRENSLPKPKLPIVVPAAKQARDAALGIVAGKRKRRRGSRGKGLNASQRMSSNISS